MTTISDFSARRLLGTLQPLSEYATKVVLVVNVASQCGNTPQYAGLEALWRRYGAEGLTVLGFPCNQFDAQEAGTEEEIAAFCDVNYGVTFPLFAKIDVNGPATDPFYTWLKRDTPGSGNRDIEWNFAKFLIGRNGRPVARFGDKVQPETLVPEIARLLAGTPL